MKKNNQEKVTLVELKTKVLLELVEVIEKQCDSIKKTKATPEELRALSEVANSFTILVKKYP